MYLVITRLSLLSQLVFVPSLSAGICPFSLSWYLSLLSQLVFVPSLSAGSAFVPSLSAGSACCNRSSVSILCVLLIKLKRYVECFS